MYTHTAVSYINSPIDFIYDILFAVSPVSNLKKSEDRSTVTEELTLKGIRDVV